MVEEGTLAVRFRPQLEAGWLEVVSGTKRRDGNRTGRTFKRRESLGVLLLMRVTSLRREILGWFVDQIGV